MEGHFSIVTHPDLVWHELCWIAMASPIYAYQLTQEAKVTSAIQYFNQFWRKLPSMNPISPQERSGIGQNQLDRLAEQTQSFTRLGFLFEARMKSLLEMHPSVKNLQTSIKVQGGERTLGEFDFLFLDSSSDNRIVHWETAVKFYLAGHPSSKWDGFIGPNGMDTLFLKNRKAIRKQLMLTQTKEGQAAIQKAFGPKSQPRNTNSYFLMMGWLFYPYNVGGTGYHSYNRSKQPKRKRPFPFGVHANHNTGYWVRHGEELPEGHTWRVLKRTEWLGDFTAQRGGPFLNRVQAAHLLDEHFQSSRRSVLLANLDEERRELGRVFVVHKTWPNLEK